MILLLLMTAFETIHETYRARLENNACYTQVSEATQSWLNHDLRRYGLRPFDRVAHGVLAFCIEEGSPICVPWLVSPDAPPRAITGGRHGLVFREFYDVADDVGLGSYTKGATESVDYDDLIGTFIIIDDANEAPITVLCCGFDADRATPVHVNLIKDLSRLLPDHKTAIDVGGEETPRKFMVIRHGDAIELSYGFQRGLELQTIAKPDDFVGKTRELESYASYAQKHGLDEWGFCELVEKAVQAFHDGRQVSLDTLCMEVLAER